MLRIRKRTVGDYDITAAAVDDDGNAVDITGDVTATVTNSAGAAVAIAADPTLDASGDITLAPTCDEVDVGVYKVVFGGTVAGEPYEWETYFEIVASLDAYPTELIAEVKRELRITATTYDDDIEALIAAAKADMRISGVSVVALDAPRPAPLVRLAIVTYCKAMFGMDNPDSERYMASFHSLETSLALSEEYQA